MLLEALLIGGIGKSIYDVDQAVKMDEEAVETYAEAYELKREAYRKVHEMQDYAEKRLANVVKKKRAVINYTLPRFAEVYGQIQKVEIQNSNLSLEVSPKIDVEQIGKLKYFEDFIKKDFTDNELLLGIAVRGFSTMIKKDSERELSAAENQLNASRTLYEQSESMCVIYEALVEHADRVSSLIAGMNLLFLKSIEHTENTINKNGLNVRNYTEYEKGVLMTCVNIAVAMTDILKIPVVDKGGKICQSALETIQVGENYLNEMKKIMNT